MDNQHREHKHSYKISIQSRKSNLSSCRSLQRPSWGSNHKSLSKNHSLVEVMSLQSGRKSDIYDKMLEESIKPKLFRQSQGGMIQGNIYQAYNYQKGDNYYQPPKGYYQRKSEEQNITINHTCTCYTQCQWQNCPCFEAKTQLCIKGYCCVGCIENKEKVLNNQLIQANSQGIQKEHMFCTCKKTKCNKKYCSCFAAGVLCGQKCSCQGCLNCLKSANEGMQIEEMQQQIDLQELNRMAMPSGIQFQPVQFRFSHPEG